MKLIGEIILPPPGSVYRSEGKPLQFISGALRPLYTRHNNNNYFSPGRPLAQRPDPAHQTRALFVQTPFFSAAHNMAAMAAVPPIMASVFEDDPTSLQDVLLPELCVLPLY